MAGLPNEGCLRMNPPSGPIKSAGLQDQPASAGPAEPTTVTTATVSAPMEQFIWENGITSAEVDAPSAPAPETAHHDEATAPHILVVSDEDEEPLDSWRRQLISALHDADRESPDSRAQPTEPPPIPPAEIERRAPIAYAASRAARTIAPAPIVRRTPRYRIGVGLIGLTATAGVLSTALSRPANIPEMSASAATPAPFMTGSLSTPTADEQSLKPIMLNSPVLVREGMSPTLEAVAPVGPMIETVRTVPVQLGTRPQAALPAAEATPAIAPPAAQLASPQPPPPPPPAPAPPALDRDSMAALITDQPAAPAPPPATAVEPPTTQRIAAPEAQPKPQPSPRAKTATTARGAQISTAYEKASPATKPQAQKRRANPERKSAQNSKTAQSSQRKQWDTRRQGLRTSSASNEVKEVAPSTMVKLLKSLNPFGSKEEPQTTTSSPKNIFK
jgi:hypothetical protein